MAGGGSGGASTWTFRRMVGAMGGDTVLKAAYHKQYKTTGSPITAWGDARGSGFGPSLTVGSAALDAGKNYLAFTTTAAAFCAANALFDLSSSCTLVYIGSGPGSAFIDIVVVDDSSSQNRNFEIATSGTAGQWCEVGPAPFTAHSFAVTDSASTPIRLAITSWSAATTVLGQIWNHAQQSFTVSAFQAAGNNALNINTFNLQATVGEASILCRGVFFFRPALTAAQIAILAQFALNDAGIQVAA